MEIRSSDFVGLQSLQKPSGRSGLNSVYRAVCVMFRCRGAAEEIAYRALRWRACIVKRAIEWHRDEVSVAASPLGGARICAVWPTLSE
jgi:hypothetical protein